MADSSTFYDRLSPMASFREMTDPALFRPVPADWWVAFTDVRGSTQAIAEGRYKEVNIAGALGIVALLNLAGEAELPFIFGGDGATLLLPPGLAEPARGVLAGAAALVRESYGLGLRVGLMPVCDLHRADETVNLGRLAISEGYHQAVFTGGGLGYAESLFKDEARGAGYLIAPSATAGDVDISGLECRWRDIPSPRGESVALVVTALQPDPQSAMALYSAVLDRVGEIFGDENMRHPVTPGGLGLSFANSRLDQEARLRAGSGGAWSRFMSRMGLRAINALGVLLMDFNPFSNSPWREYRRRTIDSCDFQKYDGVLRMVISGTPAHREELVDFLERQRQEDRLAYGVHVSDRALMTCLVFQRHGRHVHFVDAADGGYALAAREMKRQLAGT